MGEKAIAVGRKQQLTLPSAGVSNVKQNRLSFLFLFFFSVRIVLLCFVLNGQKLRSHLANALILI